MTKAEKLVHEALTLPIDIRAQLVEELLKSMNPVREEVDAAWAKEAERRLKEIRAGKSKPIPMREVFNRILRPKK